MPEMKPCLWFDRNAEEAVHFYLSVFPNSRILDVSYHGDNAPLPKGTVLVIEFELDGHRFMALNGGPFAQFTPAVSIFVSCQTQAEIDAIWDKFADGGQPMQCGWITDRFGMTWQIVPPVLGKLLNNEDPAKSQRVMQAMLKMVKLDIAGLEAAAV